jgi:transcriptional regulator with XRE-family HTH domain
MNLLGFHSKIDLPEIFDISNIISVYRIIQMMQTPNQKIPTDGPPAVGSKLQAIRKAQKLSLDDLSKRAGVSKSMLSDVERNQANPTVGVLWRLATALGVSLTDLLGDGKTEKTPASVVLVAAHAIPVTKSNDGRCELRILGPISLTGKVEWYELTIEPGGVLASDPHEAGSKEHLSVQHGTLLVQAADSSQQVKSGDTARYAADVPHSMTNNGKTIAKAVLVVEYLG